MQHITQANVTKTVQNYFPDEFKLFSRRPFWLRERRFAQDATREHGEMERRKAVSAAEAVCGLALQRFGWAAPVPALPRPRDGPCGQPPWPGHSPELVCLMQESGQVLR